VIEFHPSRWCKIWLSSCPFWGACKCFSCGEQRSWPWTRLLSTPTGWYDVIVRLQTTGLPFISLPRLHPIPAGMHQLPPLYLVLVPALLSHSSSAGFSATKSTPLLHSGLNHDCVEIFWGFGSLFSGDFCNGAVQVELPGLSLSTFLLIGRGLVMRLTFAAGPTDISVWSLWLSPLIVNLTESISNPVLGCVEIWSQSPAAVEAVQSLTPASAPSPWTLPSITYHPGKLLTSPLLSY